jgi:hypothetical protein
MIGATERMNDGEIMSRSKRTIRIAAPALLAAAALAAAGVALPAHADPGVVGDADFLGNATSLAVLGAESVTNTGPTVINGDLAIAPNGASSVTGFPVPGTVNGTIYTPPATQAVNGKIDASNAYDALESLEGTSVPTNLGGYVYGPGVYHGAPAAGTLEINGTLVLNGSATDVFVFQTDSTLITGSASSVELTGGALACNVFWQVGSSATLGTSSSIVGTIIARASVTATTGASVLAGADGGGRLFALDGSVTLDSNVISAPAPCTTDSIVSPGTEGTLTPAGQAEADAAAAAAAAEAAAAAAAQAAADAEAARLLAEQPQLAPTGSESWTVFGAGMLSLLLGVAAVTAVRRRRSRA